MTKLSRNLPPIFQRTVCAAALAVTLGTVVSSRATTLTYDGFTADANNNDNIVNQGGGIGWSNNWNSGQATGYVHTVRSSTSIAYPGYNPSTNPAASVGNFLNLAAGYGASNPTAVFRGLDVSAGGNYGTNGYLSGGVIGADNKTLWGSILYLNNDTGFGTDAKTLTLNGGGGTYNFALPQNGASNSNLLVYRIDFRPGDTDTITYFNNPNLATFDGITGGTTSAPGNYAFSNLVLTEQGFSFGNQGTETQYDDIRFGTSLSDVVPVPEPATWLGIAFLVSVVSYRLSRAKLSGLGLAA